MIEIPRRSASVVYVEFFLGTIRRIILTTAWTLVISSIAVVSMRTASSQESPLQQVVVTANRQGEQALQDTPASIAVLSPDLLNQQNLTSITEYLNMVPGVNVEGSGTSNRIQMLGIVSSRFDYTNIQDRPTVSVYLDDIPITLNNANPDLKVVDLERIEVLRGPQGTLYGASSLAGAVRYVSRKPNTDDLDGWVEGTGGWTDHGSGDWSARGFLNVPIVRDHLALTVAVFDGRNSGFIDNAGLNHSNANFEENAQARVALRWKPNDSLVVDASFLYINVYTGAADSIYTGLAPYTFNTLTPAGFTDNNRIGNVTLDYDFGAAHLISSSSVLNRDFDNRSSLQYLIRDLFFFPNLEPSPNDVDQSANTVTEEIRLVSAPGRFHWTVGGYYQRQRRTYTQSNYTNDFDEQFGTELGIPDFSSFTYYGVNPNQDYLGVINTHDREFAGFADATYAAFQKLDLTLGLRYYDSDDSAYFSQNGAAGALNFNTPLIQSSEQRSTGVNPRAVVSSKVNDDLLLFFEAARGFRYGGANYPVPLAFCQPELLPGQNSFPLTFGPDKVWSYRLGEKSTFADRRLTVNAEAFLIDWQNPQVVRNLGCGYTYEVNQGKVRSQGAELELNGQITDALLVRLSGSFTDATVVSAIPAILATDGDRVPLFPRWIGNASIQYSVPLTGGRLSFSTDYTRRSRTNTEFNTSITNNQLIPASNFLVTAISFERADWQVGLYGTNLTNDLLLSSINTYGTASQPGNNAIIGRPRAVGLRVRKAF
jgi:iron complex outermembrane recepter protein